jgi:type I restriction enzyme M protein
MDSTTRRKIDALRDTLVGKLPVPTQQVEQITLALIYKFMYDLDQQSKELGGKASFFTNGYSKYAWNKIIDRSLSGAERVAAYGEALENMSRNAKLPQLFRDIFQRAYLPFRDPQTLNLFLQQIDDFTYAHSEDLGDAFEYLLSIMDSQGDAGQFRTPRHIIDFIVECVDPDLDMRVLDPACGTAGFLISAYKHILKKYTGENGRPGNKLTPKQKTKLSEQFTGYDISHDMVRLSLVNMYLHNLPEPRIYEYDALTNEDKWKDRFDCILANPPFMTPKGGIRPHNKFRIAAKRSEVLFVDYILEHLSVDGRAGIIVPEGIIFQSGSAYKELRKILVDEGYLWAVVSLPSGIFQPYSGVKTSILLIDRNLAKKHNEILFVRVEHDGFDLGAQRRPIDKNDLPETLKLLQHYKEHGTTAADGKLVSVTAARNVIAESDYNLALERHRGSVHSAVASIPRVPTEKFMVRGLPTVDPSKCKGETFELWSIPSYDIGAPEIIRAEDIGSSKKSVQPNDVLLSRIVPHIRRSWVVEENPKGLRQIASGEWIVFRSNEVLPHFLKYLLVSDPFHSQLMQTLTGVGGSLTRANPDGVARIQIPVPPLEVQQALVTELERYRKMIEGARAIIENYKPEIEIDPSWQVKELGEIATFINGRAYKRDELLHKGKYTVLRVGNFFSNDSWYYSDLELPPDKYCTTGDLLYAWSASFGPKIWHGDKMIYHYHIWKVIPNEELVMKEYLYHLLDWDKDKIKAEKGAGSTMTHVTKESMEKRQLPLPPIDIQRSIADRLKCERAEIDTLKAMVTRLEEKIRAKVARLWE